MTVLKLFRLSSIYALGEVLARAAGLILIPIYVRVLPQSEVGALVVLQAVIAATVPLYRMGLPAAVQRFYLEFPSRDESDRFVAGLWWFQLATSAALCAAAMLATAAIPGRELLGMPVHLVQLALASGALQSMYGVLLARFIIRSEPLRHRAFTLLQVLTTLSAIIYMVVVRGAGVPGVLWAMVATHALWASVAGVIVTWGSPPELDRSGLGSALGYSLPVIPHGLFLWGLALSDRLILQRFLPLAAVGAYGVGYQLASVISMWATGMHNAWTPRFYSTAEDADGPEQYARLTTYFVAATIAVALAVFLMGPEIVRIVATADYGQSAPVIRIVVVGFVFHACYLVPVKLLFYMKRTRSAAAITGLGAAVNISFNLIVIPRVGMLGAAAGTVVGYGVMALAAHAVASGAYRVRFEWSRLGIVFGLAVALAATGVLLPTTTYASDLLLRSALLIAYPAALLFLPGFLLPEERAKIGAALHRIRTEAG